MYILKDDLLPVINQTELDYAELTDPFIDVHLQKSEDLLFGRLKIHFNVDDEVVRTLGDRDSLLVGACVDIAVYSILSTLSRADTPTTRKDAYDAALKLIDDIIKKKVVTDSITPLDMDLYEGRPETNFSY